MKDLDKDSVYLTHKVWVIYTSYLPKYLDSPLFLYWKLMAHLTLTWISNHVAQYTGTWYPLKSCSNQLSFRVGHLLCSHIVEARFVVMVE